MGRGSLLIRTSRNRPSRGQSLVEFALVFPLFFTLLLGIIEFAMMFNATLAVNYAARDGALAGAEGGNQIGADCYILKAVDNAVGAPADRNRIDQVFIYKSTPNGAMLGTPTVYTRTATPNATPCAGVDGSSVMYSLSQNGYSETNRCNILAGCGVGSPTVDNIAVRVSYNHVWVTPLRNFIGGSGGGLSFDRSSVMRMEPVL